MQNLVNVCAILYMAFAVMVAYAAVTAMPSLVLERALFVRERNDGLYYTATYLVHKMIEEILLAALVTLPVSAYCFYGIKFQVCICSDVRFDGP